ncbi:hypothetical protein [Streptomyces microflavus]|uniref:hypothetical protein n=1 Tax=Streptomyces microflavus TaxID=1919 RepID=UPI002E31CC5A|nr:hypothetical protein [Streptomyces microflavus]
MNTKSTPTQRATQLRAQREAEGENVSHLSDLDLLNDHIEQRAAEQIDTRDRYMGLLRDQRLNEDRVRASANQVFKERIQIIAAGAVERQLREMGRLVSAVEALPAQPKPERIDQVREAASSVKHMLRLLGEDSAEWKLDNNYDLVNGARHVLGILKARDGIPADEVIRLVGEALTPNGNLHDLFTVADTGVLKPEFGPRQPSFLGPDWADRNGHYAYEPAGTGARVVAFNLGNAWYLDLYSPTGALLAYGQTAEQQVADIAVALVAAAPDMVGDGAHAWMRFERIVTRLLQATAA